MQLARDHEDALAAQYPAERNDGSERLWTRMTDESTPFAAALMEDPRFLGPAQQICGDDLLGIGVDINRYVSSTTWHPDTGDENQIACKFIFYLDTLEGLLDDSFNIPKLFRFVCADKRYGIACRSRTAGSADTVDIVFWHMR